MVTNGRTKNIFDWLTEITWIKTPSTEFTESDWEIFNSWLINKFISMNMNYVEVANHAQTIPYDQKQQLYDFYREFIPKSKVFLKYIKSSKKSPNQELIKHLALYFGCGLREAESHSVLLEKPVLKQILEETGIEDKEIKKLLK